MSARDAVPPSSNAVEALRADVLQVFDDLIGVVNGLRSDVDQLAAHAATQPAAAAPAPAPAPAAAPDAALQRRVTTLELRMPEIRELRTELETQLRTLRAEIDTERMRVALAHVSRIQPKRRTVVFAGRDYFGDNLKYAYLGALEAARSRGFECWYLPHDAEQEQLVAALGGRCLPADATTWTAAHMTAALEAAVLVVCDHLTTQFHPNPYAAALFAGARWVQLWHGISIKEVGLQNHVGIAQLTPHFAQVLASCGTYASFLGSSAAAEAEWRRWFSFERYAAIGYPRNDVLHRAPTPRDLVNVDTDTLAAMRHTRARGGRAVLYVPTFRDGRPEWIRDIGLAELANALGARGDRLVVNLHPYEHWMLGELRDTFPQVHFVRERSDLYPLLAETSVLVTDYSSLMFDFLALDRDIVFFRPDHATYVSGSRALYDAKVERLPGAVASNVRELLGVLYRGAPGADAQVRRELMHRLFDRVDGHATDRLLDLIDDELARALAAPSTARPGA